jgi:hypothetical protein
MKKIYSLILSFFLFTSLTYSQLDTTGGRYCTENFFSAVAVTSNVTYGSNTTWTGGTQTLVMDIYQPTGDVAASRGLIIFAHGGSFIGGSRTDQDVTTLCTRFAKMGYVTCSIDYRLGMFPIDSLQASKAVLRGTQDMKAAVRFFRKDAATINTYKIDPLFIFAGGSSAGAFMALHLGYLDVMSEVPSWFSPSVISLGGLEGNSGNAGYSSKVNAVINLCGALGDSTWMVAGDIPLVSMHGTNDGVVPYGHAMLSIGSSPILIVDGSWSIKQRADHVGVYNPFHTWIGADHVPYAGSTTAEMAYMDSTVDFVRAFLCPIVSATSILSSVTEILSGRSFSIYPNPSNGDFTVRLVQASNGNKMEIRDMIGKLIAEAPFNGSEIIYNGNALKPGAYFLKITNASGQETVQKFIRY